MDRLLMLSPEVAKVEITDAQLGKAKMCFLQIN
jgi:hypothetical protein